MAHLDPFQSAHTPQGLRNHRLVEKDEGIQCLGLGRSSDFAADRQMIEKRLHVGCSQIPRVAFAVEENVLPDPITITFLGARAEMATTADGRKQIE